MPTAMLEAVEAELGAILGDVVGQARLMLEAADRVDTGATVRGLFYEVRQDGDVVVGRVGSTAPHAVFVHEGRRPGRMPPLSNIQAWVERKLKIRPPESRRVARAIARKIGRRGLRGTPFLTRPLDAVLPEVSGRIQAAAAAAIQRAIDETLTAGSTVRTPALSRRR